MIPDETDVKNSPFALRSLRVSTCERGHNHHSWSTSVPFVYTNDTDIDGFFHDFTEKAQNEASKCHWGKCARCENGGIGEQRWKEVYFASLPPTIFFLCNQRIDPPAQIDVRKRVIHGVAGETKYVLRGVAWHHAASNHWTATVACCEQGNEPSWYHMDDVTCRRVRYSQDSGYPQQSYFRKASYSCV